jgi:hypothetical protein
MNGSGASRSCNGCGATLLPEPPRAGEARCEGKVRACHFDPWGDKGMSTKVSDSAAMPICDGGHAEQTDVLGWPLFQSKYGFDGRDVVTRLLA